MIILGIETSAVVASVALLQGDETDAKLLAEYTINNKLNHSVNLMPMLETMVQQVGIELETIDYVAIACGPGSFTGLRIGSATAKGLAHGLSIPVIEVATLEAMAHMAGAYDGYIVPMMDARRSQVYTGIYQWQEGVLTSVLEDTAIPVTELADVIKGLEAGPCYLLGDGIKPNQTIVEEAFRGLNYMVAPAHIRDQKAGAVCMAAYKKALEGQVISGKDHKPNYIRMSQAERELKERTGVSIS